MVQVRPYQPADMEPLLLVFRKRVPVAFGESEVADYAEFLRVNTEPYFVAEHNGRVAGACGYGVRADKTTGLIIWIFADPDATGLGVGSTLLQYCLAQLRVNADVTLVECRTSQVAYKFFEKFGFVVQRTEPDFWVPGLDLYFMTLTP